MDESKRVVVIGGGAAGFFAALAAKEANPSLKVSILEKTKKLLSKVRISGGGRCNVTHDCLNPAKLVENYPRGSKELLGPFTRFGPKETITWFNDRGIELNTEEDGRIFPKTNSSETIIHCFMAEALRLDIPIHLLAKITALEKSGAHFTIHFENSPSLTCDALILATGSSEEGWSFAQRLGHTISPPVPSLFTFNIPSPALAELSGLSAELVCLQLKGSPFKAHGPILLTHKGISGPATLKLSAFAARYLAELHYKTPLQIDWLPQLTIPELKAFFLENAATHPTLHLGNLRIGSLAKNLWKMLIVRSGLSAETSLHHINKAALQKLCDALKNDCYPLEGKATNKEEFVTCGGISLKEVEFKSMESKLIEGLYFAGEVLDIDGITGGFNFQNSWTTGFIAGSSAAKSLLS